MSSHAPGPKEKIPVPCSSDIAAASNQADYTAALKEIVKSHL